MNNTLIIYDNNGVIFFQAQGDVLVPNGLQHMFVEVPEGKRVDSVNIEVTPHEVIYLEIPKSEIENKIEVLEAVVAELIMGGA